MTTPTIEASFSLTGQVGNYNTGVALFTAPATGLYQISVYIVVTACPTDTDADNGIIFEVYSDDGVTTSTTSSINGSVSTFTLPRKVVGANACEVFTRYCINATDVIFQVYQNPPYSAGSTYNLYVSAISLF